MHAIACAQAASPPQVRSSAQHLSSSHAWQIASS
jgi:hypothetical protein